MVFGHLHPHAQGGDGNVGRELRATAALTPSSLFNRASVLGVEVVEVKTSSTSAA